MVTEAGQPQILRAAQRDDVFIKQLGESISQLVSGVFGIHRWIRWRSSIEIGSQLAYYTLTTLSNLQTLGEEYTGIVQWTSAQSIPSKQIQMLMVLLNCCGERFAISWALQLENYLKDLPEDDALRPEAKSTLINMCANFRRIVAFLIRFHQNLFYFQGRYYHLSKRTTGVHYVLTRFWLREQAILPTFRLLGVVSALHLLVTAAAALSQAPATTLARQPSRIETNASKCSLCLNLRTNTSCTPCGHLFCWDCIVPWVMEQPLCPLCRQDFLPSRVVLLKNFAPTGQ